MYTNIGRKIKALAKILFYIPSVIIIIIVLVALSQSGEWGIIALLGGGLIILMNWISSWFLYGFGELIDKTAAIERYLNPNPNPPSAQADTPSHASSGSTSSPQERYTKLVSLRAQGLITEEEFQNAVGDLQ